MKTLVWVYWTLKKWKWNNVVLWDSKKIWETYIWIDKIEDCWYPMIKLWNTEQLLIEVYEVTNKDIMEWLDMLEWVPTLYHKAKVDTDLWKVIIYEYTGNLDLLDYDCITKVWPNKYVWKWETFSY